MIWITVSEAGFVLCVVLHHVGVCLYIRAFHGFYAELFFRNIKRLNVIIFYCCHNCNFAALFCNPAVNEKQLYWIRSRLASFTCLHLYCLCLLLSHGSTSNINMVNFINLLFM